jgi:hypothetical protein
LPISHFDAQFDLSAMTQHTAFDGSQRIAAGDLATVAVSVKKYFNGKSVDGVLIFEDASGQVVEVDFRGSVNDVRERLTRISTVQVTDQTGSIASCATEVDPPRGPGRPKLGVVAREVTLLPRHWDWLNMQTGGASVALRKLVEEARRTAFDKDRIRLAQEVSYRFMSAAIAHEINFEEAARALFAGKRARFHELIEAWPSDLRDYLKQLSTLAFQETPDSGATRFPK